jgi:mitochondrial cardiolipin hydrolase
VPVRTDDRPEFHMHNKFVVIDDTHLITGSFNWTVQAGKSNQENLLVVDHPYYIEKYNLEFESLWKQFNKNEVK